MSAPLFQLQPFKAIKIETEPTYLVRGLVPRNGLTLIYGPPKCGKSFFVFDLMMHVALGWPYRGRRVQQGAVVYVLLEGTTGFHARAEAFRREKLPDTHEGDVPFYLVSAPLTLVADHKRLAESIRQLLWGSNFERSGTVAIAAIVIDTVNRSFVGSESSDQDMTAYVRAADILRDQFYCSVCLVHHSGLEAGRPRGHTALAGALDAQIQVKRDASNNVVAAVDLMKDGEAGQDIVSKLRVVEVGTDDDGEKITSLVLDEVDEGRRPPQVEKARRVPKSAAIALRSLHEAMDSKSTVPPPNPNIPLNTKAILVDDWREHALKRGVSPSDKPNSARTAFRRAMQDLITLQKVAVWDDYAWPLHT